MSTRYPGLTPPPPSGRRSRSGSRMAAATNQGKFLVPDPCVEQTIPPNMGEMGQQQHGGLDAVAKPGQTNPDNLNFGWFSVPKPGEGTASRCRVGGGDEDQVASRTASRAESKASMSGSAGVPPIGFSNQPLPSIGGYNGPMEPSQFRPQENVGDEGLIVDWPLSAAAQEQIRSRQTCNQTIERPASRSPSQSNLPPTPMPPLHWDGYVEYSSRPTFANWREQWHQEQTGKACPQNAYQCPFNKSMNNNDDNNNNNNNNKDNTSSSNRDDDDDDDDDGNNNRKSNAKIGSNINNNHYPSLEYDTVTESDLNDSSFIEYLNPNCIVLDDFNDSCKQERGENVTSRPTIPTAACKRLRFPLTRRHQAPTSYKPNVVVNWDETSDETHTNARNLNMKITSKTTVSRINSRIRKIFSSLSCWPNALRNLQRRRSSYTFKKFHNESSNNEAED